MTIDTLFGHPWGWGAVSVSGAQKGWVCPECSSKPRKDQGAHTMPDGRVICSGCARRLWESPEATIVYRGGSWFVHCSLHGLVGRQTTEAYATERREVHIAEAHG